MPLWARGSQGEPGAARPQLQRPAVRADPQGVPLWARGPHAEPGAELPAGVADTLSGRLGFDVSQVRIHAGTQAAEDNRRLGSVAHTVGRDVSFSRDAYAPHAGAGQALLAHELTHVAQQLSGNTDTEDAQEREAESVAAGGSRRPVAFGTGTPGTHGAAAPRWRAVDHPGRALRRQRRFRRAA